jgi:ABC-type nitrate/sulfonate/bicarbonate transport system ATPase subunit
VIAARSLAKRFGETVALADVSLELAPGELVALVGPSGCGKTTLLRILAGLIAPDTGELVRDARAVYMPQGDSLLPWRRTLDNVTLGLELAGVRRGQARQQAAGELERFGLAGFGRHWPRELSGGMRQRAALLRTFLAGSELLLLDEPFAALDALTREELREWLLEVWEAQRRTVLVVTHDVEEAVFLADRVLVMSVRPGRVREVVEVSLARPRLTALLGSAAFVAHCQHIRGLLREERTPRPVPTAP